MARQVRSEVTRRKILDAAIDVFSDVGYAAAGWGTIIERTGMTKGALYHHFESKEALASDIIDEGADVLVGAFRSVYGAASPALENMIHGTFAMANMLSTDKTARAAEQLIGALSGFNDAAARWCAALVAEMTAQAREAIAQGDLREDIDPGSLAESIVGAMFGTRLFTIATARSRRGEGVFDKLNGQLSQLWMFVLPGVAAAGSLPYFQQFLAREALRHTMPSASVDAPIEAPQNF